MKLMKILQLLEENSLTGTHFLRDYTWTEILDYLQKTYGIYIGSGAFADVLISKQWDYVYKIFQKDDPYMEFVQYCMQNPNNPHLPKILKRPVQFHTFFKRPIKSLDKTYAVKLEKLYPITHGPSYDFANFIEYHAFEYITNQRVPKFKFSKDDIQYDVDFDDVFEHFKQFDAENVFKTIKSIQSNVRHKLDIHIGNIMQRKDGTIVIIDPVVDSAQLQANIYEKTTELKKPIDDFRQIKIANTTTSGPTYNKK